MSMRHASIIPATLAATLLLGGCSSPQPDYTPFGDGIKAIGISLVVVAVVGALADALAKMADDRAVTG